jgi:hypothetical protein
MPDKHDDFPIPGKAAAERNSIVSEHSARRTGGGIAWVLKMLAPILFG